MAIIKPFKAIRPKKEYAKFVAAVPYDVVDSDEARKIVRNNNYSFLHIDKAEIDLDKNVNIYDDAVYNKAKENFINMINNKIFIQDNRECFYIYEIISGDKSQTGIVVCTSVDEYINGNIKKHELTREDKELDRIKHVDTLNANTGPIFMAYRYDVEINDIIECWKKNNGVEYNFTSSDGNIQKVWIINDIDTIEILKELFDKNVKSLYIADGHHRNASAFKVALKRREKCKNYNGSEEFNYYLSVLFPDSQLNIIDYNRLIKDFNGLSKSQFIEKLSEKFNVEKQNEQYKPSKIHTFGFYTDGQWYSLELKKEFLSDDILKSLDVSILQQEILSPILNISDVRTSKRIDFVGGSRGLCELERRVDSNEMVGAFSMYPTSMKELFDVADSGNIMPPKSTWFEPKLKSGLFIHSLY